MSAEPVDLDDFVVRDLSLFHLEQMDAGHWWAAAYKSDGTAVTFNIYADAPIRVEAE